MCFLLFKLLGWDDRVARIPLGGDVFASSISSAAAHLFVRTSEGKLLLYDSYTLEETFSSPIVHGERLYLHQANSSGTLLATYGYHTVKIWKVSSGTCEKKIQNLPTRPRPLAMRFVGDRLLIGSDDCKIRSVDVGNFSPTLDMVADLDEPEFDDHHLNAASLIAFIQRWKPSSDCLPRSSPVSVGNKRASAHQSLLANETGVGSRRCSSSLLASQISRDPRLLR